MMQQDPTKTKNKLIFYIYVIFFVGPKTHLRLKPTPKFQGIVVYTGGNEGSTPPRQGSTGDISSGACWYPPVDNPLDDFPV